MRISPAAVHDLERRKQAFVSEAESICTRAREQGRETLTSDELLRFGKAKRDAEFMTARVAEARADLERGYVPKLGRETRAVNSGARVAPIGFDPEELRHAHGKLMAGESVRLEARAFTTASPILPAELAPYVTELQHEGRILDHLPAIAIEMPSIEVIQINSVTGAAAITPEGAVKPEIVPQTTALTVTAQKIAAHVGLSYEALSDFDVFSNYVRIELQRQVIQTENYEVLYGAGGTGGINGFFTATGILSFDASTADQPIDAIEQAISALRVGPSLATPNLIVLNPATWSAIRRTKDTLGRYLLSADPAEDEADSIWGIDVVVTTQCNATDGLLVDTTKYGRAVIREALSMRIGWSGTDFVQNVLRTVSETRLNNAIERPTAVLYLKNLSTTTTTTAKAPAKASK